jgi:hypothetical protein
MVDIGLNFNALVVVPLISEELYLVWVLVEQALLYSGFLKMCASRPFTSSHQRFFFSRTSRIILGSMSFVVLILVDLLTASIEKV